MNYLIAEAEKLIAKYPLVWQFFKFCLVGLTNLAIYLSVYWVMTRFFYWSYLPASIIGFLISVTWSFFINRKWTFKHIGTDHRRQYVVFIIANIISMTINLALLSIFIEIFKFYDITAQLICSVIVAFFNFCLNRFWTFRSR